MTNENDSRDGNPFYNHNMSEKEFKELKEAEKELTDLKLSLVQSGMGDSGVFGPIKHGADIPERNPLRNRYPAIWDLVIEDMVKRDKMGTEKYKTRLRPFNGRNPLWDAYQEALDMVVYLRQAIYEQEHGSENMSENIVPRKEHNE